MKTTLELTPAEVVTVKEALRFTMFLTHDYSSSFVPSEEMRRRKGQKRGHLQAARMRVARTLLKKLGSRPFVIPTPRKGGQ